jgi:uncharacterized delta-60 repeat protein
MTRPLVAALAAVLVAVSATAATAAAPGPQGLDARFGVCGTLTPPVPRAFELQAKRLARAPGGAVVAAGQGGFGRGSTIHQDTFVLTRFSADGQLDRGFGGDGVVTTTVPRPAKSQDASLTGLVVQPDGKVVVSGTVNLDNPNDGRAVLIRYNVDGSLDPSFGSGGVIADALPARSARIEAIALAPDGRIVAAGTRNTATAQSDPSDEKEQLTVARFLPNGSLDPAFGTGGFTSVDPGFGSSEASSVRVLPDGRVLAAGRAGEQFALLRLTAAGTLDPTFGDSAGATYDSPPASAAISAFDLLPDGRIVAVGPASNVNGPRQLAFGRYTADGRPDATFGKGGFQIDRAGSSPTAIAVAADGKLVVTGGATFGGFSGGGGGLLRYGADGTRDAGFGIGGALVGFSSFGLSADDVLLQPDGTALVAEQNGLDYSIARFAVDEPALSATAAEPRVCSVRVTTKSLRALLRRGHGRPFGKLLLAFQKRQPGPVRLRAVARAGGRTVVIGSVVRRGNTFAKDIADIGVSRAAARLLQGRSSATIVVTAQAAGGGAATTGSRTLKR